MDLKPERRSREVGYLGQLHPLIAERFDLEGREVYVAELDFDTLVEHGLGQPQLEQLARFPGLDRDLALVLDRDAPHAGRRGAPFTRLAARCWSASPCSTCIKDRRWRPARGAWPTRCGSVPPTGP